MDKINVLNVKCMKIDVCLYMMVIVLIVQDIVRFVNQKLILNYKVQIHISQIQMSNLQHILVLCYKMD